MSATTPSALWLPKEIWVFIAGFLDNEDFARFRQVSTLFKKGGSDMMALQPLYNRLYALDKTLPALLNQQNPLLEFKNAFQKIQARQEQEILYLTRYHPALMKQYTPGFQENTTVSLKSLEARHAMLDNINYSIIENKINLHSVKLNLEKAHITRLSTRLFQTNAYLHFWQNLTVLNCGHNNLITLNVQGLIALQELHCSNNELTTLNVQGAPLKKLYCYKNFLTKLNVQGMSLTELACEHNVLTELHVQGIPLQTLGCYNNLLTELNVQRMPLQTLLCDHNHLTELNVQGLPLTWLSCRHNFLTQLNVQGLALKKLWCENNPLIDLNLAGVPKGIKNNFGALEKHLLFKRLSHVITPKEKQEIITRLGAEYTHANYLYYFPTKEVSPVTARAHTSIVSPLWRRGAFLPTFSKENPLKRPLNKAREENQLNPEMIPEDADKNSQEEPDRKRRKQR